MENEKLKHLEFIQNTITRMNINSFQIKGWTITIVSATIALSVTTKNSCFVLLGIFSTILFWVLDANYLTQERRFRGLYNDVAGISEEPVVLKPKPFTMEIKPYDRKVIREVKGKKKRIYSYWFAFRSSTVRNLYFFIIIMLIVIFIYLNININDCQELIVK